MLRKFEGGRVTRCAARAKRAKEGQEEFIKSCG